MEKTLSTIENLNPIELEEKYCAHNYKPLDVVIERGEGVWLYDTEGVEYLDFMSAYSAVPFGHCNERINKILIEQGKKLDGHKSITSLTGIGDISAAILLNTIGDVSLGVEQTEQFSYEVPLSENLGLVDGTIDVRFTKKAFTESLGLNHDLIKINGALEISLRESIGFTSSVKSQLDTVSIIENLGMGGSATKEEITTTTTTNTITVQVSQSSDDAEEQSGGSVGLTSSDLELVQESTLQTVGIRFQGITVPKSATIQVQSSTCVIKLEAIATVVV